MTEIEIELEAFKESVKLLLEVKGNLKVYLDLEDYDKSFDNTIDQTVLRQNSFTTLSMFREMLLEDTEIDNNDLIRIIDRNIIEANVDDLRNLIQEIREWYNLNREYSFGQLKTFSILMISKYSYESISMLKMRMGAMSDTELTELDLESVNTIIEFILETIINNLAFINKF